uniref:Retrovirus-related Pol polyprotein from transposon TNT 1-94 n=1 Tax=Cajanus cajan TaxID=3821 RepID=A0A151TZ39_CAJCA|nr:Retrovirus-related Pol polyprotein from transposon TNT 1-94 [Cajanus cajan]
MASPAAVRPESSIFTNYVNVPLSIDKLDGTNYDTWASDIKLWLKGQDYVAHLTQTVASVDEKDRPRWSKIDAQICSVLKSTIHPSLKQIFRAHKTCVDVWEQARLLYTNDTQRLYGVSCHKLGHTIDRCYVLHGRPTRPATDIAHSTSSVSTTSGATPSDGSGAGPPTLFYDFLKWHEERQASNSTASVAHIGPSFVGLTHSTSLGPWVLDSGATDHISGNRSLFSSLSTSRYLPSITMANGSRATSHGVGTIHLSPSLSIDNVLYVPESPFNLLSLSRLTRSLDCLISFTKDSAFLQDRSSGRMIGTGCESHGLYHLRPSAPAGLVVDSPSLIHAQLGHPSLAKLQHLVPRLSKLSHLSCESCQLGKHSRSSFSQSVPNRALSPFALVHSNIWGPSRVKSTLEFQYFVTFIDDYSRCTWLFLMKNRSELFFIFQSFYNEIHNQFGVSIRTFHSDNAREYLSHSFQAFMTSHGILHQTSCAYTPQQNGVAERKNRHLLETTRTLLLHGHVPQPFWDDVVLTACYLVNRMPSSVLNNQISHRVFGSTCFVHNHSPGLDKLSAQSHKCVFLGYPRSQKGYKCFSPSLRRYLISADVTFLESSFYFPSPSSSSTHVLAPSSTPLALDPPLMFVVSPDPPPPPPLQVYHRRQRSRLPTGPPGNSLPVPPPSSPPAQPLESDLPISLQKGNRSTRNPSPHYITLSYHRLSSSQYTCLSSISSVSIPKTVGDALAHPGWRQAMIDELCALQNNGTWDLVPLPLGKYVVGCRWIFTIKVGPYGTIDHLKARLVVKGYTQIFGLDYGDTFSPVAKMASVKLFLAMAALRRWPLYQLLDVKNAFLHGDLLEKIYVEQPPGFVAQGESSDLVCRLRKSLYGLKQSPRAWFGRFSTVVQQFGMTRSEADHSVFYRHSTVGCIYLIVYVDDIVLTGSDHHAFLR